MKVVVRVCPYCGHENPEDILACSVCSRVLRADLSDTTLHIPSPPAFPEEQAAPSVPGATRFPQDAVLSLQLLDPPERLLLRSPDRLTFGRKGTGSLEKIDVNLTPHGGLEKGVSRLHAVIRREGDTLLISDLGSTNGTYLNGKRLVPHESNLLHDGSEVRLGKLVIYVRFIT